MPDRLRARERRGRRSAPSSSRRVGSSITPGQCPWTRTTSQAARSLVSAHAPSVVTGAASGPPQCTLGCAGVSACASTYSPFSSSNSPTCLRNAVCASTCLGDGSVAATRSLSQARASAIAATRRAPPRARERERYTPSPSDSVRAPSAAWTDSGASTWAMWTRLLALSGTKTSSTRPSNETTAPDWRRSSSIRSNTRAARVRPGDGFPPRSRRGSAQLLTLGRAGSRPGGACRRRRGCRGRGGCRAPRRASHRPPAAAAL